MLGGVNGQIELSMEAQDVYGNTSDGYGGTVDLYYCPG